MLSYAVMTVVDTLFVGRLGPSALAGVGLGGTAAFALACFSFGLLRGTKVLISQARGAGNNEELGSHLGAGLATALVLGVVTLAAAFVTAELLPSLAATAEAGANAQAYFKSRMITVPALFVYVALRESRYGLGDARSPMVASVLGNVVNIGLDYVLIFGFDLGVGGAGAATATAHALEAAVLIVVQARMGFDIARTRWSHVRALWRMGLPSGIQFMLEMGSFAVLATLLSRLSEFDMAGHLIALQVVHFSFLPAVALAEAASVLTGEAIGARRDEMVVRVSRLTMILAAVYTGACGIVMAVGGRWIAGAFTEDPGLIALATKLLVIAAIFQVFDAANIVSRGVLRGVGDVRFAAVAGITLAWISVPPLTWFLGYHLGLGAVGGWLALLTEIILGAFVLVWRVERGGWHSTVARLRAQREAVQPAEPEAAVPAVA